jgi:hypothetical protein
VGKWETCLWFSTFPSAFVAGAVGISPSLGEISKGLVERVGSLLLAFHSFHSPGISTALLLLAEVSRLPVGHPRVPMVGCCAIMLERLSPPKGIACETQAGVPLLLLFAIEPGTN